MTTVPSPRHRPLHTNRQRRSSSSSAAVGSSLVGLGDNKREFGGLDLGLWPNANIVFGIHEFAEYDPIAPWSYFNVWRSLNGTSAGVTDLYLFNPGISSATVARRYGISSCLSAPVWQARPEASSWRTRGMKTSSEYPAQPPPLSFHGRSRVGGLPIDAPGKPVRVERPTPSEVRIVTDSPSPQVLRLRIASFPGWEATIDGRSLPLATYLTMMLQAHIPPGKHVIELRYWPTRFTEGLVIAGCAVVAFGLAALVVWRRKAAGASRSP